MNLIGKVRIIETGDIGDLTDITPEPASGFTHVVWVDHALILVRAQDFEPV